MPLGPGRYRVKTTATGKQVRLHFTPGGTVDEAKNIKTGQVHTPSEFARDRMKTTAMRAFHRARKR
jgi:hypothetical protein